jgi:predicted enzyme related to lactoylglutathione lyase
MSIGVKEVAYVCHPSTDIPRARAFYEGVLGLKPLVNMEGSPGMWWIEYDVGGTALAVTNFIPCAPGASPTVVALEVADLDAALAAVQAAAVPVTLEIQDFGPCRMFTVTTPDAHGLMFHQRKS